MRAITSTNDPEYHRAINMLSSNQPYWAYDTETTGLNTRKDTIIGFGISQEFKGFYFCHKYYENGKLVDGLSKEECLVILNLLISKKLIMWNASYDSRITLSFFGVNLMNSLWAEGTVAKHLVDESGSFRLKDAAVKVYGDQEKAPQKDLNEDIKSKGGKPGADIYMGEKNLTTDYQSYLVSQQLV